MKPADSRMCERSGEQNPLSVAAMLTEKELPLHRKRASMIENID